MNRARLEAVRDALRKLPPPESETEASKAAAIGWYRFSTAFRPNLPNPIDTFDMGCFHISEEHAEHGCRTRGCIAGVAIDLFLMEAAEIANRPVEEHSFPFEPHEIAQEILGLDTEQRDSLFLGSPGLTDETLGTVTPEEAAVAVENLLAGNDPGAIWDHVQDHRGDALHEADTESPAPPAPATA